jgi:hypothetical protein
VPAWLPRYDLDIQLDLPGHTAHVRQRVTFTNRHERPATELVFNAHAHYHVPPGQVGLLAKTLEILRVTPSEALDTGAAALQLRRVALGDLALAFSYQGDTETDLVVPLPGPVRQGEAVTVVLEYDFRLPQKMGRWGQYGGVTQLSNWVPVLAVYDEQGWHPVPFCPWHQPWFNEAGTYTARVVLPCDQKIACTGSISEVRKREDGMQEVLITAPAVRDFAFLCSARYREFTGQAGPVAVHVLAFPEHEHFARAMIQTACEVIPRYGKWIGPYPWPDFTIAEAFFGWNGNECATLVMIDERVFGMPHIAGGYVEYLIAHEICHQWWYNVIGTNGYCETWMDEAWATHFAHRYLNEKHGRNSPLIRYPKGLEWLPTIGRDTYRTYGFYGMLGRGDNGPILRDMPQFGHVVNLFSTCYDKGSKVVGMIEDRLGPCAFLDFMRIVYARYQFRILRVADFQRELEEYTGQSWEQFFRDWLHGKGLCDWSIEKVELEPLAKRPKKRWAPSFLKALHHGEECGTPYQVTVLLHQKADVTEQTVLGFCLRDEGNKQCCPYHIRVPILPQVPVLELDDPPARIEVLPDKRVRVHVLLPDRPRQIAVDPDKVLVDANPANNYWRPFVRVRLTPLYTMLEETDITNATDRWNILAGPWLYGAAYNDPWYTRSSMVGLRAAAYRTQWFVGGAYAAYRTDFRDLVVGVDGFLDHWPYPHAQLGFNLERRLDSLYASDTNPSRAVLYGRHVFQYTSSLYQPPMHYAELFGVIQDNFLPFPRDPLPGGVRFRQMGTGGLHYHINYLTPYWDPEGGFQFDATWQAGAVSLQHDTDFLNEGTAQLSFVKYVPDLSGWCERVPAAERFFHWLADTRLAFRVMGAAGLPNEGEYFALGGSQLFRGFDLRERQGSVIWVGSVEWRVPLARDLRWDACDHVFGVRNLYSALFYDVGDAYVNGHSEGPVAHAVGLGLRADTAWFGFLERTTLRFDLAKTVNANSPLQFWFGVQHPF